jgi:hypothetical protein
MQLLTPLLVATVMPLLGLLHKSRLHTHVVLFISYTERIVCVCAIATANTSEQYVV